MLTRGADEVRPYSEPMELALGKMTTEQRRARCPALGIDGLALGAGAAV